MNIKEPRLFRIALDEEHIISEMFTGTLIALLRLMQDSSGNLPSAGNQDRPCRVCLEICDDDGDRYSDLDGVSKAFSRFYEKIYNPLESECFDDLSKSDVESKIKNIIEQCENDLQAYLRKNHNR